MPPDIPGQPTGQPQRAAILISDSRQTPAAIDAASDFIRRRHNLTPVGIRRDNGRGDEFADLVDQWKRGLIDVLVLPDETHLPPWIRLVKNAAAEPS